MDTNNILISSGVSIGFYALYKGAIRVYQHYYLNSECHSRSLTISIEERKDDSKERKDDSKEPDAIIEMEKTIEKTISVST